MLACVRARVRECVYAHSLGTLSCDYIHNADYGIYEPGQVHILVSTDIAKTCITLNSHQQL